MSFTRINGSSWSVGDKLTSAQMNALDVDHANAIDKTAAGDTVSGLLTFSGASAGIQLSGTNASGLVVPSGGGIEIQSGGSQTVDAGGFLICRGAMSLTALATLTLGASNVNLSNIQFATPQVRTIYTGGHRVAAGVMALGAVGGPFTGILSSVAANNPTVYRGGFFTNAINTANANTYAYCLPLEHLHNGATISSAILHFSPTPGHSSLPADANMPAYGLFRASKAGASVALASGAGYAQFAGAAVGDSVATYNAGNLSLTFTPNQNNVVDLSQYAYYAVIWDEANTNAIVNGFYWGVEAVYGAINDMRFQ